MSSKTPPLRLGVSAPTDELKRAKRKPIKTNKMNELTIKNGKAYKVLTSESAAYNEFLNGEHGVLDLDLQPIETADDLDTCMRIDGSVYVLVGDSIGSYDLSRELISRGFLADVFHTDQVAKYELSHSGALQLMYDALISEQVQKAVANEIERIATTSKRYKQM